MRYKKDPWILGVEEMNEDTTDELAPRAEIFRSKLIEDFQLIDRVANSSGTEPPKYYSNEVTGIFFFHDILWNLSGMLFSNQSFLVKYFEETLRL